MRTGCLPPLVWVLTLPALVIWVLGTPGIQGTNFANGWSIGFVALLSYGAAWPALAIATLLLRRLRGSGSGFPTRLQLVAMCVFLAAMLVSVVIMTN